MLNLSQRQTFVTRNLLISSMVIASFTHRTLKESDNSCGLSLSLSHHHQSTPDQVRKSYHLSYFHNVKQYFKKCSHTVSE